jgi:basic amino acid/polyamine antiporter, APA family
MENKDVFLRRSSGVIRTMTPRDAAFYGYLVIAGFYGVTFYFLSGPAIFPGANIYLAMIILLALFAVRWVTYSGLISAMPRSGGDYVFSSRLVSGLVGFVTTNAGMVWWQVFWDYLAGNTIALVIIPGMLDFVGHAWNMPSLINAGLWFANPWVGAAISIILLWIALGVMLTGLKAYVLFQNYFIMTFGFLALVIVAAMFIVVPQSQFIANFNSYQNIFGYNPDWYHAIISAAKQQGFNPDVGFSWYDTIGLAALYYGLWTAVSFGMELVGEIKGVQSFKTAWITQYGAIILEFITFAIGIAWATDYMGPEFVRSLGYLSTFAPGTLPNFDFRGSYALFTVVTMNVPIGIIIGLAFAGAMGNSLFNGFLGASRLVLAQSFDRIYPSWFGHVNRRGAPDNILILMTVMSSIAAIILTNYPNLVGVLQLALMAQFIGFAASIVGGIGFPWKAKSLYEASPVSKYKIAGIPAITVCGIIGLGMDIWAIYFYLTNPNYGIWPGTSLALGFASALYIVPFVYYLAIKMYRRRQGIFIERAFKEVPPA